MHPGLDPGTVLRRAPCFQWSAIMATRVRVQAHWIGPIDVDQSNVQSINPSWLGGACGCRIELRDGRWFATSREDAERLSAATKVSS
jgi:hypothetical protein